MPVIALNQTHKTASSVRETTLERTMPSSWWRRCDTNCVFHFWSLSKLKEINSSDLLQDTLVLSAFPRNKKVMLLWIHPVSPGLTGAEPENPIFWWTLRYLFVFRRHHLFSLTRTGFKSTVPGHKHNSISKGTGMSKCTFPIPWG